MGESLGVLSTIDKDELDKFILILHVNDKDEPVAYTTLGIIVLALDYHFRLLFPTSWL